MSAKLSSEYCFDSNAIAHALNVKETFVRSDVQVNFDNSRAKGRRLTGVEVAFNFGANALKSLIDKDVFVIQNRSNASSQTISRRLTKLGVSRDKFSDDLDVKADQLSRYIEGREYFPIRKLELACALLGIEESRISGFSNEQDEPSVRLRYYDSGDAHNFSENLVEKISGQSWKIGKIEYLKTLVSVADFIGQKELPNDTYVDPAYASGGGPKPAVKQGEKIAARLRESLSLKPVRKRAVSVTEALQKVGVDFYSDGMEDAFCGMTLISAWSGKRVVIANTRGENSKHTVRRFTLAHELAHAASDPVERFVQVKVGLSAGGYTQGATAKPKRDLPELRANSFAANFLAPEEEVKDSIAARPRENAIDVLCDEFAISRPAAKWRLVAAGLADSNAAVGGEDTLFGTSAGQVGDEAPSLDDQLRIILNYAHGRKLIHGDTVESTLSICERLAKR